MYALYAVVAVSWDGKRVDNGEEQVPVINITTIPRPYRWVM